MKVLTLSSLLVVASLGVAPAAMAHGHHEKSSDRVEHRYTGHQERRILRRAERQGYRHGAREALRAERRGFRHGRRDRDFDEYYREEHIRHRPPSEVVVHEQVTREVIVTRRPRHRSALPIIVGGVLGGVIGNEVGHGDAATAAVGAVAGSVIAYGISQH